MIDADTTNPIDASRSIPWWLGFGLATALGVLALIVLAASGFDPPDADVKFDWLSAKAAFASNSYDDIRTLADEFGKPVEVSVPTGPDVPVAHPRTPGAIFLSLPLLLLDFDRLVWVSIAVTIACGIVIIWPLAARIDLGSRLTLIVVASISAPVFITLRYTGQAGLVAALTLVSWALTTKRRGVSGGLLLAMAGVLKVFPLLLLVPLLLRRRYLAVSTCVAAVVGLNLAGILLPGVSLGDATASLRSATTRWMNLETNGSLVDGLVELGMGIGLAQFLVVVGLTVVLTLAYRHRRETILNDPLPWLVVALMTIPLSWISYDFVLIPAMGAMLQSPSVRVQMAGVFGWALWIIPAVLYQITWFELGAFSLAARMLLLGAWWLGWLTWTDEGAKSTWMSTMSTPATV